MDVGANTSNACTLQIPIDRRVSGTGRYAEQAKREKAAQSTHLRNATIQYQQTVEERQEKDQRLLTFLEISGNLVATVVKGAGDLAAPRQVRAGA